MRLSILKLKSLSKYGVILVITNEGQLEFMLLMVLEYTLNSNWYLDSPVLFTCALSSPILFIYVVFGYIVS